MKKRLVSIMNVKKKKAGVVIASGVLVMTSLTGGIFAVADGTQPATLLANVNTNANEQIQNINFMIIIDGYKLETEHAPYYEEIVEDPGFLTANIFVPFVDTIEAIGGTVKVIDAQNMVYTYQDQTSNIKIADGQITMKEIISEKISSYDEEYMDEEYMLEEERELETVELPIQMKENVIYVSLNALFSGIDLDTSWSDDNVVYISASKTPALIEAFYETLRSNDFTTMKQLIVNGEDVNARNKHGQTMLQMAITNNNKELVAFLLDANADVNVELLPDQRFVMEGQTLLDTALKEGNKEIISAMLAANPTIDKAYQPFYKAVEAMIDGDKQALQQIINKGFDINTTNKIGDTLISLAAQWDKETVQMLEEAGANLDQLNSKGLTSLMLAAQNGDTEMVSYLLQAGANIDVLSQKIYEDTTALMFAAEQGHSKVVQKLIDKGANLNLQDVEGNTALNIALYRLRSEEQQTSKEDIVLALTKANANVNLQNEEGQAALHLAYSVDMARILLDAGAKMDLKDNDGFTPLTIAALENKELVTFLIEQGANKEDINIVSDKTSPLINATRTINNFALVQLLVDMGADVNIENERKETPLMNALRLKEVNVAKYLIDKGANVNHQDEFGETPLMNIVGYRDAEVIIKAQEIVKALLGANADVNMQNESGSTALMLAVKGDAETSKMLLDAGAKVNVQSNSGYTALMYAARSGNVETVKMLLAADADPTLQTKPNEYHPAETALDLAKEEREEGNYEEIIKLLEEAMK
ncbi:ankyrin repeat domain-containing protein [Longirhabdus pacifica]|uniref:ankyrin repeat domain-containing protein n=1 Tax=Longirhabdus pacifica TaxID=2305227 RepID=UPI001008698B|nr:ankyrin repeat domain-containing protein [Longirhabdus pacifica]